MDIKRGKVLLEGEVQKRQLGFLVHLPPLEKQSPVGGNEPQKIFRSGFLLPQSPLFGPYPFQDLRARDNGGGRWTVSLTRVGRSPQTLHFVTHSSQPLLGLPKWKLGGSIDGSRNLL